MSALPVTERAVRDRSATQPLPRVREPAPRRSQPVPLRVVQRRNSAPRAPFVLLMSGLLAAGLIGVLLVNTRLAQGSFTVHQLQLEQSNDADQVQALSADVSDAQAPQALAARAIALGMVPAPNPVFKRDGAVLGAATVARKPPPPPKPSPSVSPSSSVSPSASGSTSPSTSPSASGSAKASGSPSSSAKPSASPNPSAKPSVTPKPSATPKPSGTPKPTATPKPSGTPKPSTAPTAKPTAEPTAKPTAKATPGAHT